MFFTLYTWEHEITMKGLRLVLYYIAVGVYNVQRVRNVFLSAGEY